MLLTMKIVYYTEGMLMDEQKDKAIHSCPLQFLCKKDKNVSCSVSPFDLNKNIIARRMQTWFNYWFTFLFNIFLIAEC